MRVKDQYASPPSISTIVYYWHTEWERLHSEGAGIPEWLKRAMIDLGEPRCWGCNNYTTDWDYCEWSKRPPKATLDSLCRNWNRLPLYRCHIIPKSRGGSDHPKNLVLLCGLCHSEAPDNVDPTYMIEWLNRRERVYNRRLKRRAAEACESLGLSVKDVDAMIGVIQLDGKSDEYDQFEFAFSSAHWGDNGGTFKLTSYLSSIDAFYKQEYGDLAPQEEMQRCMDSLRTAAHAAGLQQAKWEQRAFFHLVQ